MVSVRLVFVKKISISRCGWALYKLVVDDLQKVKVSLVNIATARFCDHGNGAVKLESLLFMFHEEIARIDPLHKPVYVHFEGGGGGGREK